MSTGTKPEYRHDEEYLRITEYIRTNTLRRWSGTVCNCGFD